MFLYVLMVTQTDLVSSSSSSLRDDEPLSQVRRATDSLLTGGVHSKLEDQRDANHRQLGGRIPAFPSPVHTLTEHGYGQRQGSGHAKMMIMSNPNRHSSRHGPAHRAHHGVRGRSNPKRSGSARGHSHQHGRSQGTPRRMATEKKRIESSAQGAGRKRAHRGTGRMGGPRVASGGGSGPERARPSHEFESRIVGGFEAESGAFKFFASLDVGCGGSLIAPNMVLTAAHCGGFTVGTVRIGSDDYSSGGVTRSATSQCSHPKYTFDNDDYDYMLVMLDEPVDTTEYPLIELNKDSMIPEVDDMLSVIGFGLTSEDGEGSQKLLQVDVPMNSFEQCNEQYGGTINDDIQFCAGFIEGGKDSCQGDSGGPIFEMRGSRPVQVGVVSFGEGCARPDRSGVYARVSGAIDWIEDTMAKLDAGDLSGCSEGSGTDGDDGGSLGDDGGWFGDDDGWFGDDGGWFGDDDGGWFGDDDGGWFGDDDGGWFGGDDGVWWGDDDWF